MGVVADPRKLRRVKKHNFIEIIENSMTMLKKIVEMQNLSGHIHNMSTANIIKLMLMFWFALLLQLKLNQNARTVVIKTLLVLGGITTVFGTAGTTGLLIYKHWKKRKSSSL
jgi:hypothetical protein